MRLRDTFSKKYLPELNIAFDMFINMVFNQTYALTTGTNQRVP
jgi:hypothetical protein